MEMQADKSPRDSAGFFCGCAFLHAGLIIDRGAIVPRLIN